MSRRDKIRKNIRPPVKGRMTNREHDALKTESLGDLWEALRWLVNKLEPRNGVGLPEYDLDSDFMQRKMDENQARVEKMRQDHVNTHPVKPMISPNAQLPKPNVNRAQTREK